MHSSQTEQLLRKNQTKDTRNFPPADLLEHVNDKRKKDCDCN